MEEKKLDRKKRDQMLPLTNHPGSTLMNQIAWYLHLNASVDLTQRRMAYG